MANIILLNEQMRSVKKLFLYAIIFSSALTIYADDENYNGQDVSGRNFAGSDRQYSTWVGTTAIGTIFSSSSNKGVSYKYANFTNAILVNASFEMADDFASANFTNAVINGANFSSSGFTKEQLYSTKSYKNKDISGIDFSGCSFRNCDFSGQDLTNAKFSFSELDNANFTNAVITGADFSLTAGRFTKDMLYSTKSYKDKDLSGINLEYLALTNLDFSGQNLTNANINFAHDISSINFTDAIINGATIGWNTPSVLTKEQLYSTKSYKDKNLSGVVLTNTQKNNDMRAWDFSGQNLVNSGFISQYPTTNIDLTNANFSNANLANGNFTGVTLENADFTGSDLRGINMNRVTGTYKTKNTIMTDGRIENFSMVSSDDNFSIRKYAPASEGGEMISAKISEAAAISGGAALTLENGAELEVLNAADLTVENGSSIIINTDADSSTSFKVNSGGGLAFENGAILEINVVSDLSAQDILQIEIMEFAENASIAGLDALVKGETILLNVNGSEWLGEWDYALENNQMLITVSVPEPAVCAAAIGALALGLALRYRNYKN